MISFIVIEYYSVAEIQQCLKSIQDFCNNLEYELIVSSNSCYNTKVQDSLRERIKDVKWVFNSHNGGFAYGMNKGLEQASGDYLVIMNPDVEVKGNLSVFTEFLDNHKDVAAIAPQLIGYDGQIQDSCRQFVTLSRFLRRQYRRIRYRISSINDGYDYNVTQTVDCVIGAFIMMTREAYRKIGGLCEDYFMYAEDIDWCTRAWKDGYKVVYCPRVKAVYEGTRSARKKSKYAKVFIKSHIKYWNKFGWFGGYPKSEKIIYND